ncbi:flavoprotein [Patescibacteria group bacterium]
MKLIVGVTGSVAATLTPKLLEALAAEGHTLQVVATKPSLYFWDPDATEVPVWLEEDEWQGGRYAKDQPIPHIDLREWADAILISPLTANTLAKIAGGMADNLLTSVARAWNRFRPFIVAPSMNTQMWEHPATKEHLETLDRWYKLSIVEPVSKKLACGETGKGALAPIEEIVAMVNRRKIDAMFNAATDATQRERLWKKVAAPAPPPVKKLRAVR